MARRLGVVDYESSSLTRLPVVASTCCVFWHVARTRHGHFIATILLTFIRNTIIKLRRETRHSPWIPFV